ncbi:cobalamin biosynthesis protein [Streptomyces nanshensis]|uniref:cobalamin biosynthesis protein n=1 Tax=Streptomyces nanshensis TaxID=518642 RepID=UPI000B0DBE51|nr:cobalamin biosynthesis protein [Streptomyces nanshensis]
MPALSGAGAEAVGRYSAGETVCVVLPGGELPDAAGQLRDGGGLPGPSARSDGPDRSELPGWCVEGDVACVARALLDGLPVELRGPAAWLPQASSRLGAAASGPRTTLWVTDEILALGPGEAVLRPPSLSVGIGAGRGVSGADVVGLVERSLAGAGLSVRCVAELATVDAKAGEPGLLAAADRLKLPLRSYPAHVLAAVEVPNPSDVTRAATGTPSVAEAAAVTAAGDGARLVVPKAKSRAGDGTSAMATAAVARVRAHRGRMPEDPARYASLLRRILEGPRAGAAYGNGARHGDGDAYAG